MEHVEGAGRGRVRLGTTWWRGPEREGSGPGASASLHRKEGGPVPQRPRLTERTTSHLRKVEGVPLPSPLRRTRRKCLWRTQDGSLHAQRPARLSTLAGTPTSRSAAALMPVPSPTRLRPSRTLLPARPIAGPGRPVRAERRCRDAAGSARPHGSARSLRRATARSALDASPAPPGSAPAPSAL